MSDTVDSAPQLTSVQCGNFLQLYFGIVGLRQKKNMICNEPVSIHDKDKVSGTILNSDNLVVGIGIVNLVKTECNFRDRKKWREKFDAIWCSKTELY